jgi:hypothetical protein
MSPLVASVYTTLWAEFAASKSLRRRRRRRQHPDLDPDQLRHLQQLPNPQEHENKDSVAAAEMCKGKKGLVDGRTDYADEKVNAMRSEI